MWSCSYPTTPPFRAFAFHNFSQDVAGILIERIAVYLACLLGIASQLLGIETADIERFPLQDAYKTCGQWNLKVVESDKEASRNTDVGAPLLTSVTCDTSVFIHDKRSQTSRALNSVFSGESKTFEQLSSSWNMDLVAVEDRVEREQRNMITESGQLATVSWCGERLIT